MKVEKTREVVKNPIKKIRDYLGLTQSELGVLISRSQPIVTRYEQGATEPSEEVINSLNALMKDMDKEGLQFTQEDFEDWVSYKRKAVKKYLTEHRYEYERVMK